jgi:Family of unknown function (DUF6127)
MIEADPIKTITISEYQLEEIIEKAAARGATAALARVGLDDEHAARDVTEFRNLLDAYRGAKKTMVTTAVKWVTTFVIGLIAATLWIKGGGPFPKI